MRNNYETGQEQKVWEKYDEPVKQAFNPYLPELYALLYQVDETKTNVPDLAKLIETQSADFSFRQAITSIGNRTQLLHTISTDF